MCFKSVPAAALTRREKASPSYCKSPPSNVPINSSESVATRTVTLAAFGRVKRNAVKRPTKAG